MGQLGTYVSLRLAVLLAFASCILGSPVISKTSKDAATCTTQQHRPQYHFTPKRNWMNDPNGMVYYQGDYHLYFQYHPGGIGDGPKHWGHAISWDLATWEEVDIALYPDDLGAIWSGSSVVDFLNTTGFKQDPNVDPIVAIYTSTSNRQVQSIAYSLDKGMTFTKYENNPVLTSPTGDGDFRDPKVSWVNDTWVMVLAVNNRIEFYTSPNLKDWRLDSEFGRDPSEGSHGGVWECPDLVTMEVEMGNGETKKVWVLVVSEGGGGPNQGTGTQYFVGDLVRNDIGHVEFRSFGWDDSMWLDWGPDNYAGVSFSNFPNDKTVYMGWMSNGMYAGDLPTSTWRSSMTIPRELSVKLDSENRYRILSNPVRELEDLRNPFQHFETTQSFRVPSQTVIHLTELATFSTPRMELDITLNVTGNGQFSICAYNSDEEEICFGHDGAQWHLDRSRSGNVNFHDNFGRMLELHARREVRDDIMRIKLMLDVTTLEVFADGGLVSMTALHYPSKPFDKFYINNWSSPSSPATVTVQKLDIWGLLCWYPEVEE